MEELEDTTKTPSARTVRKLGRDTILYGVSAMVLFFLGDAGLGTLELPAEQGVLIVAGINFVHRYIRQLLGAEPTEA